MDEARELLRRIVKYAREDRATTPGVTRLERVLAETERFLARASEPEQAVVRENPYKDWEPDGRCWQEGFSAGQDQRRRLAKENVRLAAEIIATHGVPGMPAKASVWLPEPEQAAREPDYYAKAIGRAERAARERLGAWLTSGLGRSFDREEHCDRLDWQRRIVLTVDGCETIHGPWLRTPDASGCPDDALNDYDAINAALDLAEAKEPTT